MRRPEDVLPHLGKAAHWKQGRSAKALADAWFSSRDVPRAVRRLLATADYLADAELLEAWLERETDLRDGRGSPSHTDLLALIGVGDHLGVLGVEAKVDESFGPFVAQWSSEGGDGRTQRLRQLCDILRLDPERAKPLRYQLLHRTAAILLEAQRFRTGCAVLIVHSFCPRDTGLADCTAFFDAIGMAGFAPGLLVGARRFAEVDLWAGWANDAPRPEATRENVQVAPNP